MRDKINKTLLLALDAAFNYTLQLVKLVNLKQSNKEEEEEEEEEGKETNLRRFFSHQYTVSHPGGINLN